MIEIGNQFFSISTVSEGEPEDVGEFSGFAKNGMVRATVLKAIDGRTALLSINGRKFSAQTHIPLKAGAVMTLTVKQLSPVTVLQPVNVQYSRTGAVNMAVILSAMKDNFWKAVFEKISTTGMASEKVLWNETVKNLPQQLLSGGGPACLHRMVEKSGLDWEAKLGRAIHQKGFGVTAVEELIGGDLKGSVSRIMARNIEADQPTAQLLLALKNLQVLNRNGLSQEHKIFLPLPVQLPDGHMMIIQLLLQLPPKEEQDDHGPRRHTPSMRISLLLELTRIGPVRADFELKGNTVTGVFNVAMPETRRLIENQAPALVQCLTDKGFIVQRIRCRLKAAEIVAESLIREIMPIMENNIHLVA